ncbi:MAG: hypothetical protein KIC76_02835 [Firmicutes bacterium]|nr:hypothetical protein [Bacillota bacterium]
MDNKKIKIVSIISIIALALTLVAATYAYFVAQTGEGAQTDIKINANTVDAFTFEVGSALNLSLNQENFASGKGNQTGTTFAKAMLSANNKTNTATEHYYLYLNISNNTFTYSIDNNTPEILLSIKDGSNNEITTLTGLTYKTVTDGKGASIKGFDITNKKGLITILNNREITTTSTKTEEWNVTVTFVNYNSNQAGNAGKSFNAKLMIQKEEYKLPTLAEYVVSQYTGTQGDNGIYYHNSSLANGAGDNSYRYAGASESVNNFICFGSTTSPCPTDNLYRIIGVFGENNHGVTGKQLVKLIKYDYATSNLLGTDGDYKDSSTPGSTYKGSLSKVDRYYWNSKATNKASNTWSTSLLNKINLNTNYLNNIGTTWSNLIEDATWKVSGHSTRSVTPSEMYTAEITNATKTYGPSDGTSKIGLMYVSDYGFAASPSAWTETLANYDGNDANGTLIKTINWMYMGNYEWTISPYSSNSFSVFTLNDRGDVNNFAAGADYGSRPVLYLKASVLYAGGLGTKDSPITLVV